MVREHPQTMTEWIEYRRQETGLLEFHAILIERVERVSAN